LQQVENGGKPGNGAAVKEISAMLARRGKLPNSGKLHLIEAKESHSQQIHEVLKKSARVDLLDISFPDLIANPQRILRELTAFLGDQCPISPKVEACIRPELHRNPSPRDPRRRYSRSQPRSGDFKQECVRERFHAFLGDIWAVPEDGHLPISACRFSYEAAWEVRG
jgi:hypothetical protein